MMPLSWLRCQCPNLIRCWPIFGLNYKTKLVYGPNFLSWFTAKNKKAEQQYGNTLEWRAHTRSCTFFCGHQYLFATLEVQV